MVKKDTQLNVRIPVSFHDRFIKEARDRNMSQSDFLIAVFETAIGEWAKSQEEKPRRVVMRKPVWKMGAA